MYPLTVAIAIETKELWEQAQACLRDLPVRVVLEQQEIADSAALVEQIVHMQPDIVLLDITKVAEPEMLVRQIRGCPVEPIVIALHTTAAPDLILAAMRGGASEYVYPPLQVNLKDALERRSGDRSNRRVRPGGKILAFLSAKGGCGATTVACHMAVELGRLNPKTLIADLDLDSGMIAFLMKSHSDYTVLDAVRNLHRLDESYWKAIVSNGYPGLEIIGAPTARSGKLPPGQQELRHILAFTRTIYDWTLVDLGRGMNDLVLNGLSESDEAYIVTTLDVPALHQAKQIVQKLLDGGFGKDRMRLVLNRAPKRMDVTAEELEKMLGIPIHHIVPEQYQELHDCYSEGKLLSQSSTLGKHFQKMAGKLAGVEEKQKKRFFF